LGGKKGRGREGEEEISGDGNLNGGKSLKEVFWSKRPFV